MAFELADDNRGISNTKDEVGTVVIKIVLVEKGHRNVRGNINRSIRLKNCKVSEVYDEIVARLIKEEDDDQDSEEQYET